MVEKNNKFRTEAYRAYRRMLWDAIDNKKEISIVEVQVALGLYERKRA
jgi:hypothetical protein